MGSSSLLKTEHEITIKIVSFVIFAPSSDIVILNVKPGSSISILFWLIWTKKKRKKKEEERGNCSSEYLCIPFSIKDMAVTCFLRNDFSSVAKSSCAPQWCHSRSSCDVTNLFEVILTMLYQIRPWEIFPSRAQSVHDMLQIPQCRT